MLARTVPISPETPGAQRAARILTFSFGATTVMWMLCYLAMLQPGQVVGEALFVMVVLTLLAAGVLAGATTETATEGAWRGGWVGLISAILNLLLVGSLIGGESQGGMAAWFLGLFLGSMVVGVIGGLIGSKVRRPPGDTFSGNWLGAFAFVSACIVFLMIITGGIVTGFEAGLAVPDWPNSYGHNMLLYPLSEMVADLDSGIYYEHAHRLTGMYVGLTVITLCVMIWWGDRRAWVGVAGTIILLMVIFQGVLGGLRVTGRLTLSDDPALLSPNTAFGIVHGVFGQICFAGVVMLAAVMSNRWVRGPAATPSVSAGTDRFLGVLLLAALTLQLIIGATYRHLIGEMGVKSEQAMMILTGHIFMAVLVTGLILLNGLRASSFHHEHPILKRIGIILLILVGLQLVLGVMATIAVMMRGEGEGVPALEVLATSIHQANGGLLLGGSTLLAFWYFRLLQPGLQSMARPLDSATG
ncbi:MAG: COX15/CtaA family protein [Planctomycetota bacterium]|nr:COX15/CtaA family protein [Planctomycetota bacterium]